MVIDVNVSTNGWTIAGVIASFLIAGIALWLGLRANKEQIKQRLLDKRERAFNELINWAVELLEFSTVLNLYSAKEIYEIKSSNIEPKVFDSATLISASAKLASLSSKGMYFEMIFNETIFGHPGMSKQLRDVMIRIGQYGAYLQLKIEKKIREDRDEQATRILRERLRETTLELIGIAFMAYKLIHKIKFKY